MDVRYESREGSLPSGIVRSSQRLKRTRLFQAARTFCSRYYESSRQAVYGLAVIGPKEEIPPGIFLYRTDRVCNRNSWGMQMKMEQADALLEEWYDWTRQWRPRLGMPSVAPYCREWRTGDDYDDEERLESAFNRATMEAVDCCVNSLPPDVSRAIGLEMRRRRGMAREWSRGCPGISYRKAVMALLPRLSERCLL